MYLQIRVNNTTKFILQSRVLQTVVFGRAARRGGHDAAIQTGLDELWGQILPGFVLRSLPRGMVRRRVPR
jgi:hypothetical protein